MARSRLKHKLDLRNIGKRNWQLKEDDEDKLEDLELNEVKSTWIHHAEVVQWLLNDKDRVNFPKQTVRLVDKKEWELELISHELKQVVLN